MGSTFRGEAFVGLSIIGSHLRSARITRPGIVVVGIPRPLRDGNGAQPTPPSELSADSFIGHTLSSAGSRSGPCARPLAGLP